jgi:hypothetical protein
VIGLPTACVLQPGRCENGWKAAKNECKKQEFSAPSSSLASTMRSKQLEEHQHSDSALGLTPARRRLCEASLGNLSSGSSISACTLMQAH